MERQSLTDKLDRAKNLREVVGLFFRLGVTAFGGPAAHIGMMHDEVVKRRKWLDDQGFLDLLGATNLIPGPNSTEMAIHLSFLRAGWRGLVLGGASFIFPAFILVVGLAYAYVQFGSTPTAEWLLYGVKPVVIAVIFQALIGLGGKAAKGLLTVGAGVAVFVLYFLNINEIYLLFGGGLLVMLVQNFRLLVSRFRSAVFIVPGGGLAALQNLFSEKIQTVGDINLSVLFLTFLKIGSILYGSGYVLLAFLRADFVVRLGWLTDQQLIDAVAIGQVTPGPVFTTATFIGYILGGFPGALLGTLGIFLPSFIFVALSSRFIPRMRRSPWAGALLDGVNAASLGLMAAVTVQLAGASMVDPLTWSLAIGSAILLLGFKVNSTWLIAGGGAVGLLRSLIG